MPDWRLEVRRRLASLRLAPAREAEIAEELSQHLDDRYTELVDGGTSPDDARRMTLDAFARSAVFDQHMAGLRQTGQAPPDRHGALWRSGTASDLRHAARAARRNWGHTLVVTLTLALAIGTTAALVSAVRTIVIRPLPYAEASRLVNVWLTRSGRPNWHFHVPPADVEVMRATNHVFSSVSMYDTDPVSLTGSGGPKDLAAATVSANVFATLGAQPRLGRAFVADDEEPDRTAVAILADGIWRSRFGGDPAVVGATIRLDDHPYRVIGVMPPGLEFPAGVDLWRPRTRGDTGHNAYILARLERNVSVERAQADMPSVVAAITGGRSAPGMAFVVEPLKTAVTRTASSSWMLVLAAAACVFGIGCLNVSNLILLRGTKRRREVGVRLALGATRGQIVRWLASESLLLAALGGLVSVPVGYWTLSLLRVLAPADTPRLADLSMDPAFVLTTAGLSVVALIACGVFPALRVSRDGAGALSTSGTAAAASPADTRLRHTLVAAEVAMATVLLVGASLVARSLIRLTDVPTGFRADADHVLTVTLHLPPARFAQPAQRVDFVSRALDGVRALPGVQSASASTGSILTGLGLVTAQRTLAQRITRDAAAATGREEANLRHVDPAYFDTMGIGIVAGRGFTPADRAGSQPVAIVNQTMARAYGDARDAVGRRFAYQGTPAGPAWLTIVGVAGDTRDIALTRAPEPSFFVPLAQDSGGFDADGLSLLVRTAGDPLTTADAVRAQLGAVDANVPIGSVSTLESGIDRYVAAPRFRTALLAGFGAMGLVLALMGAYAVTASWVAQRTSEMALRMALGATRSDIVRLVLTRGLLLAVAGIAAGQAAAMAGSRWLSAVLFGVAPLDPLTLLAVPLLVAAVVVAACCVPAYRAASTDAAQALRG